MNKHIPSALQIFPTQTIYSCGKEVLYITSGGDRLWAKLIPITVSIRVDDSNPRISDYIGTVALYDAIHTIKRHGEQGTIVTPFLNTVTIELTSRSLEYEFSHWEINCRGYTLNELSERLDLLVIHDRYDIYAIFRPAAELIRTEEKTDDDYELISIDLGRTNSFNIIRTEEDKPNMENN